ncbi:plancitoxin-1-like isoform X1 [Anneissia japonica]|uniref:plancitoxin-1-like isoform X1 n=1 Tax=Anneissia japonica TaxID=1529436 RepID=UPI0014258205|nr:plancitoxin-1-like isoform X1 [Anneissia japonica]
MNLMYVNVLVVFMLLSISCCTEALSCLDRSGHPVDWFIALKLSKDSDNNNELIRDGVGHVYMDENIKEWQLSDVSMNDSSQSIGYTLQQIYDNPKSKDVGYIMYNDEWPNGPKSSSRGHTKGALAFDSSSGFWLIHSTPKFPDFANKSYVWPNNALPFGQSFLCITFDLKQFQLIGEQLLYNYPSIYDSNLPDQLVDKVPSLRDVVNDKHTDTPPYKQMVTLYSKAGREFQSFSKSKGFNQDIYANWLAPYWKTNLFTETWQNGGGKLKSNCSSTFTVQNIKLISLPGIILQKETKDHSKWAVSTGNTRQVTCIGGINRMEAQFRRAGGLVCSEIPEIWKAFRQLVNDTEPCPGLNY